MKRPSPLHWCAGQRVEGLAGRAEHLLSAGRGEAGGHTCGSNAETPVRTARTLCTSRPHCGGKKKKKMYTQTQLLKDARSYRNLNLFRLIREA